MYFTYKFYEIYIIINKISSNHAYSKNTVARQT